MPPRKATEQDYIKLQGGIPKVSQDKDGLWHLRHNYREDYPDVRSHKPPLEGEPVNINGVLYNPRLLWEFYGDPCETESRRIGGKGYPRGGSGERTKAQICYTLLISEGR